VPRPASLPFSILFEHGDFVNANPAGKAEKRSFFRTASRAFRLRPEPGRFAGGRRAESRVISAGECAFVAVVTGEQAA